LNAIIKNDLLTLAYWTNRFTADVLAEHPHLGIYDALAHFLLGQIDQVEGKLKLVEQNLENVSAEVIPAKEKSRILWEMAAIQAVIDNQKNDRVESVAGIQALIQSAPSEDNYFTGFLANSLAISYDQFDEIDAAISAFDRGCQFAQAHKLNNGFIHSHCELARMMKKKGSLTEADRAYRLALEFARPNEAHIGPRLLAMTGLMEIALERNNLEEAGKLAEEIVGQYDRLQGGLAPLKYQNLVLLRLATFLFSRGEKQIGNFYFEKAAQNVAQIQENNSPYLADEFIGVQAQVWIASGNYDTAEQWLKSRITLFKDSGKSGMAEKIALTRIYLTQGSPDQALSILTHLCAVAQQKGMRERQIEINILKGLAYSLKGDDEKAVCAIKRALTLAEPEGYIRIFVNQGKNMQALLVKCLAELQSKPASTGQQTDMQYLLRLISAFDGKSPNRDQPKPGQESMVDSDTDLLEPLSARESEVLSMLLAGKSVKEIAAGLAIAPNTARAHVRSIHKKMDVHSRQGVFIRARDLKMG
jgi:LuxR family transcriptional regulator, maltose regulon positive regulatory protein